MTAARAPYISPPSDDSEEPDNAFAPIVMVPIAGGCKAMLGVNELGQVRVHDAGKFLAFWRSRLPGADCTPRPVSSIEFGQQRLAEAIRDWFAACGHPLPREGNNS
jgi:hypothetical protein